MPTSVSTVLLALGAILVGAGLATVGVIVAILGVGFEVGVFLAAGFRDDDGLG